jgi:hypothetical protein
MMEHGAGGDNTLSKLNDPNLEIMFSKLLEGSGEVTLAENEKGKMYLKGEGTLDGEDWSYNLNLSEFDKLDAKGDSLAITTISNDDLGLLTVGETAAATSIAEQAKNTGITTEYTNVDTMRNNLNGSFSNSVDKLIANPDFNAYWADKIYKQHDVDYLMDNNMLWDAADDDKRKIAKDYLIEEMINQIPKEQQIQFKVRNEDGTFDPSSGVEGVDKSSSTWNINALVATETGDTEARDTATIYIDDPVGSMKATSVDGDTVSLTEKGNTITVTTTKEGYEPSKVSYDLNKEDSFIAYHQKIRERNERFEGTAQGSQKRKEQFPQILKMEFLKKQNKKRAQAARNTITDDFSREDFKSQNDTSGMSDDEIFTAYREEVEARVKELEQAVNYKVK